MSRAADSRAETAKLARLLGVEDPKTLAFLLPVPAGELREYRAAVTDLLYDENREQLQRTAEAAALLPARTLAAIGEHALGPLICARLSGLLEPRRAVEIAERFSVEFLAQLAAEIDPRRAAEVVSAISTDRALAACVAMAANGEHVAMGRFVAHLEEEVLTRCIEALGDEDLLRVAFVIEDEDRLAPVFALIGPERTAEILTGAHASGLAEEAESLAGRLEATPAGRGTLALYNRRSSPGG